MKKKKPIEPSQDKLKEANDKTTSQDLESKKEELKTKKK